MPHFFNTDVRMWGSLSPGETYCIVAQRRGIGPACLIKNVYCECGLCYLDVQDNLIYMEF